MFNAKDKEPCVLCGQPVEIAGFSQIIKDDLQKFCCAGCLSIYQLFNNDNPKSTTPLLTTKK